MEARARPAAGAETLIPSPADEELALRYSRHGDRDALDCLVRRYSARLRRMLFTLLGADAEAVRDAEQEVFVALVEKLHRFRGDAAFGTFFYRLARNRVLDILRGRGRYRRRVLVLHDPDQTAGDTPPPEQLLLDNERIGLLRRAMERLPPEDRLLLYLRDGEGRGIGELCELTGFPAGTVKSRLARGRRKVAIALEELGYER